MKFCPECGFQFSSGTEKFCPNCGFDISKGVLKGTEGNREAISIQNRGGDVTGVGVSGTGHIIGKQITINQSTYNKLEPEFKNSLDDLLALINKHSEQLPENERKSINESIDGLAKATEGLKVGQVLQDQQKKDEIKSQQITLADKIVKYVPKVAESIASATPLAPFSKVVGEGAGYFAEWIKEKLIKK
jgi:predicted  nucleic acid-binding Zn-ribbon protein